MSKFLTISTVCIIAGALFRCSPAVKKESIVDTPQDHYKIGMQKLETNNLKTAETEFIRAIELDDDSPPGYTGMAFLELRRSKYKSALKRADKSIKKDPGFTDAYIARGCAITHLKRNDAWFGEACSAFQTALEIDPDNERALFYFAESCYEARKYDQSLGYFTLTIEKNGSLTERSHELIAFVKKVMKAEPLSDEGHKIAHRDKINRADLCMLLIEELDIKDLLKRNRTELFKQLFREDNSLRNKKVKAKSEVSINEAKAWILEIIPLNIPSLNLYPDGFFYPDRLVTKSLLAEIVQEVIVLVTNDPTFSTKYIGMDSPFNDVHANYYAFNAIELCIENGIMDFPGDGNFKPDEPVSGIDAILMLRVIGEMLGA